MQKEAKENCANENCLKYFSFFNHKLYESPSNFQIEEYSTKSDTDSHSLEASSIISSTESLDSKSIEEKFIPLNLLNISPTKISNENEVKSNTSNEFMSKDIQSELQKYKLPKSLFDTSNSKEKENEKEKEKNNEKIISLAQIIDKNININSQPFVPKNKEKEDLVVMKNQFNNGNYNKMGNKFDQIPMNYLKYNNCLKNNKKKKKKKEFIEREGDWSCYRCKNINFSFRDKCNKCQFSKEESEKKFIEVGEALLKLANMSIYDKK